MGKAVTQGGSKLDLEALDSAIERASLDQPNRLPETAWVGKIPPDFAAPRQYAFSRRAIRVRVVQSRTGLTLSPVVVARLRLAGGVALRGDVRHAFALDHVAQGGTQVAGGISLPL